MSVLIVLLGIDLTTCHFLQLYVNLCIPRFFVVTISLADRRFLVCKSKYNLIKLYGNNRQNI